MKLAENISASQEQPREEDAVYDVLTDCLQSSICIFAYSKEAQQHKLPLSRANVLNKQGDRFLELYHTLSSSGSDADKPSNNVQLVELETSGLCYGIEVHPALRVIRVVFRGSTTVPDWMTNSNFRMSFSKNPLLSGSNDRNHTIKQAPKIGIHTGFRQYLFGTNDTMSTRSLSHSRASQCLCHSGRPRNKTEGSSKYDRIFDTIRQQQVQYPNYQVQVTGHSLGGAMATLCSFALASDNLNVTCVSWASPRLGNGNFHRAFQQLELWGRLRALRVVNSDDIVTALPDATLSTQLIRHAFRSNWYFHTGICIFFTQTTKATKNNPDSSWGTYFPTVCHNKHALDDFKSRVQTMGKRGATVSRLIRGTPIPQRHDCRQYAARLLREEEHLRSLSWQGLYEEYFVVRQHAKKKHHK